MRYSKREVNETDPLDIYREIKSAYLKWSRPDKLYIDFTGGTKSMSAAAAMAGAVINVNILVREYRCSGGTDTANPAAGNRCSGTGIPHLLNCLLPASLLA